MKMPVLWLFLGVAVTAQAAQTPGHTRAIPGTIHGDYRLAYTGDAAIKRLPEIKQWLRQGEKTFDQGIMAQSLHEALNILGSTGMQGLIFQVRQALPPKGEIIDAPPQPNGVRTLQWCTPTTNGWNAHQLEASYQLVDGQRYAWRWERAANWRVDACPGDIVTP